MLSKLLGNFSLFVALSAIFLAQILKVFWNFLMTREWDFNWLFNSGGMPSGHSSAVTALATSIGLTSGFDSEVFALAAIVGIIIMYDAVGVRRHAGIQAKVLNNLIEDFAVLLKKGQTSIKLKELLGHKPVEVFMGAIFGMFIALFMYWLKFLF